MDRHFWDINRIRKRHVAYRYLLFLEVLIICIIPLGFSYPLVLSAAALVLELYVLFFLGRVSNLKRGRRTMYLLGLATFLVELIWFLVDLNRRFLYLDVFFAINQPSLSLLRFFLWFLFFGILLIRLIKALIREPFVTTSVVMGAGAGYLMLGFVGGVLLNTIFYFQPVAFVPLPQNPTAILNIAAFGYLTTLGSSVVNQDYPLAQIGALLITLGGQLYVAILIALVLGRYHSRRS
jgi:hypothetical protein